MFQRVPFETLNQLEESNWNVLDGSFELLGLFDDIANVVIGSVKTDLGQSQNQMVDSSDKREQILIAGESLFSQKPIGETTIIEIAAVAEDIR